MEPFNETEIRILQEVQDGGVVRGNMLRRRAQIKDVNEMAAAVQHLLDLDLIAASGSTADPKAIMSAYLSPVPSTRSFAKEAVKKKR